MIEKMIGLSGPIGIADSGVNLGGHVHCSVVSDAGLERSGGGVPGDLFVTIQFGEHEA